MKRFSAVIAVLVSFFFAGAAAPVLAGSTNTPDLFQKMRADTDKITKLITVVQKEICATVRSDIRQMTCRLEFGNLKREVQGFNLRLSSARVLGLTDVKAAQGVVTSVQKDAGNVPDEVKRLVVKWVKAQ